MNVTATPSTATTDADQKATIASLIPAIATNLPVANESSLPMNPDERPLTGLVTSLYEHERLEAERLRAVQEELVARQRFD